MEKIVEGLKKYVFGGLAVVVAVLSGLLFASRRRNRDLESEVATEKANAVVKESDHDRAIAKQEADGLVNSYESLKRKYDESGSGGDTDL